MESSLLVPKGMDTTLICLEFQNESGFQNMFTSKKRQEHERESLYAIQTKHGHLEKHF